MVDEITRRLESTDFADVFDWSDSDGSGGSSCSLGDFLSDSDGDPWDSDEEHPPPSVAPAPDAATDDTEDEIAGASDAVAVVRPLDRRLRPQGALQRALRRSGELLLAC